MSETSTSGINLEDKKTAGGVLLPKYSTYQSKLYKYSSQEGTRKTPDEQAERMADLRSFQARTMSPQIESQADESATDSDSSETLETPNNEQVVIKMADTTIEAAKNTVSNGYSPDSYSNAKKNLEAMQEMVEKAVSGGILSVESKDELIARISEALSELEDSMLMEAMVEVPEPVSPAPGSEDDPEAPAPAEPTDPTPPPTEAPAPESRPELAEVPQSVFESFQAQLYGDERFGEAFTEVLSDTEIAQFFEGETIAVIEELLADPDEPTDQRLDEVASALWARAINAAQEWLEKMNQLSGSEEGDSNSSAPEDIVRQIKLINDDSFFNTELNDQIDQTKTTLLDAWKRQHATPAAPAQATKTPPAPEPAEPSPAPESLTLSERAQAALDAFRRDFDLGFIDEQIDGFPPERRAQARAINRLMAAVELRVADLEDDIENSDETTIQRSHQRLSRQLDIFRSALQDNGVQLIRPVVAEGSPTAPETGERPSPFTEDWVNGYKLLVPMRVGDEGAEENLKHFPKDVVEELDDLLEQEIDEARENPNYVPVDSLKQDIRDRVYRAAGIYRTSGSVDLSKLDEPAKGEPGEKFNDFINDAAKKINDEVQATLANPSPVEAPPAELPPTADKPKGMIARAVAIFGGIFGRNKPPEGTTPQDGVTPPDRPTPPESTPPSEAEKNGIIDRVKKAIEKARLSPNKKRWVMRAVAGVLGAVASYGAGKEWGIGFLPRAVASTYLSSLSLVGYNANRAYLATEAARSRGETTKAKLTTAIYKSLDFIGNQQDLVGSFFVGAAAESLAEGAVSVASGLNADQPNPAAEAEPAAQAPSGPEQPAAAEPPAPTGKSNIDLDDPALGTLSEESSAVPQKDPANAHIPGGGRDAGEAAPALADQPATGEAHYFTPERTYTVQEGDHFELIARDVDQPDAGVVSHGGIVNNPDGTQSYSAGINETDVALANKDMLIQAGASPDDFKALEDLSLKLGGLVTRQDLMDHGLLHKLDRINGVLQPGMELIIPQVDLATRAPVDGSAAFGMTQVTGEVDAVKAAQAKP